MLHYLTDHEIESQFGIENCNRIVLIFGGIYYSAVGDWLKMSS